MRATLRISRCSGFVSAPAFNTHGYIRHLGVVVESNIRLSKLYKWKSQSDARVYRLRRAVRTIYRLFAKMLTLQSDYVTMDSYFGKTNHAHSMFFCLVFNYMLSLLEVRKVVPYMPLFSWSDFICDHVDENDVDSSTSDDSSLV